MEKVLVINEDDINNILTVNGLLTEDTEKVLDVILNKHYFCERNIAEYCDTMRQIIPYVVLRKGDEVFLLERLKKQTEKRLHGMLSIGIGGHINPDSEISENPIKHGLYKELHEEIQISSVNNIKLLGIINDLSTPVSKYHIGLLYELYTSDDVYVLETEKMNGRWIKLDQVKELTECMETWSQIALEYIS
ncbi:MAG: hypothetical protein PHF63_06240 [Herbinix sp.]|nr:hypothetical protein [Herbinix sp.]